MKRPVAVTVIAVLFCSVVRWFSLTSKSVRRQVSGGRKLGDKPVKRILLILALVVAGASQSQATIILSDNFESEPVPPIPPSYIGDYRDFANWDVIGGGVDLVGPGGTFPPRIDSIMVDLDGTSGSTLVTKQTFNLRPGMYYTLTFDLGGPVGGTTLDAVVVEWGNVFNESITIMEHDPFVTFTRTIQVTEAMSGKLSFTDLGADSNGAFLDNVQLDETVIPEPSTLVLLTMAAVGLLAYAWRRYAGAAEMMS